MSYSQNKWSLMSGYGDDRLVKIPYIMPSVRDVTAGIFTDLVEQYHMTVESLAESKDHWGFAPRPIRGGTTPSNHASGTAIDLRAQKHPLGKRGTFSSDQVGAIRRILARYTTSSGKQIVRWGGDYTGRADEMHFEIVGTIDEVREVTAKLGSGIELAGKVEKVEEPAPVPADAHVRSTDSITTILTRYQWTAVEAGKILGRTSMAVHGMRVKRRKEEDGPVLPNIRKDLK